MMIYTNDDRLMANPYTMTLADGESFQCRPMRDKDVGELDLWVRAQFMQSMKDFAKEHIARDERNEFLLEAGKKALDLTWMRDEGFKLTVITRPGLAKAFALMVRRDNPGFTEADAIRHLQRMENLTIVVETFLTLNIWSDEKNKAAGSDAESDAEGGGEGK